MSTVLAVDGGGFKTHLALAEAYVQAKDTSAARTESTLELIAAPSGPGCSASSAATWPSVAGPTLSS